MNYSVIHERMVAHLQRTFVRLYIYPRKGKTFIRKVEEYRRG